MARYRIKEVGQTVSGKKSPDDTITLKGSKFQIGDFMDIAIKVKFEFIIYDSHLHHNLLQLTISGATT